MEIKKITANERYSICTALRPHTLTNAMHNHFLLTLTYTHKRCIGRHLHTFRVRLNTRIRRSEMCIIFNSQKFACSAFCCCCCCYCCFFFFFWCFCYYFVSSSSSSFFSIHFHSNARRFIKLVTIMIDWLWL